MERFKERKILGFNFAEERFLIFWRKIVETL